MLLDVIVTETKVRIEEEDLLFTTIPLSIV